jgi:uncharacterized repeat protein (TIGR02543 family)
MSRNKLAGIIIACTVVIIVAILLIHFEPWEQRYMLSVNINPLQAGSVSPEDGRYRSGEQVLLTASPASGYTFDHWGGSASGTSPTVSITMNRDHSITANFETASAVRYDLTISGTAGGSVASPGEGTFTYDEGGMVNLVATPDANHQFVNWTGDVGTIADVDNASSTIIMDSDRSVTANFKPTDSLCNYECQQKTPGGYVGYQFEQSNFSKYEIIFNWTDTPKSNDVRIYPALLHFWFEAGGGGYTGPQIEVYNSGEKIVKKVIFSIWSMNNEQFTAHPYCSHCVYGDTEGNFAQCVIHNDPSATRGQYYEQIWEEGKEYKITVQKDEELADGVVWKATIEDLETGLETLIGKIKLDDQNPYKGYGLLNGYTGGFFEYYFGSHNKCLEAEYGKIIRKGPFAENVGGVWLPRKGTCDHSECIRAKTYSPEVGVIVEEVGKGVERSPEEPLKQILWEFEHDIQSTEDAVP